MFTRLRLLLRTHALRLALRAALLNVLVLALALAALFVLLHRYTEQQIESALAGEAAAIAALPPDHRAASVAALAAVRSGAPRYYRLEDARRQALAGNVAVWPDGLASGYRSVEIAVHETGDAHPETERLPAFAVALADGERLLVAQAPGALEDLREIALLIAAAVLGVAALLSLGLGVSLGSQWLARIEAVNATAGKIAAGDYAQRVPLSGRGDEFDLLAGYLNAMLARIEAAVAGMRDVSDNVAHDLRRPLARLKTRIEVALAQPRTAAEYRGALAASAADTDELMHTFEALLSIARLEAGSEILAPQAFDLAAAARGVAELYADEAEDAGRPFVIDLPETMRLRGASALVAQALANLLDNALKHTAPTTPIEVRLAQEGGAAVLAVVDHGAGIADADKPRMPERFARGDAARSQPGSGLGLALAAAVARAHGGALQLADTPGGGLTVKIMLPLG